MPLVCERMVSVCSPSARALGAWKLPEQVARWARSRPHAYVVLAATCQANVPVLSLVGFAGFSVSCGAGVRVGLASAVPASGPAMTAAGTARAIARAIQRFVTPSAMAELLKAGEIRYLCRTDRNPCKQPFSRRVPRPFGPTPAERPGAPCGQALQRGRPENVARQKLGQAWRRGASVPQSMRPSPVIRIR